MVDNKLEIHSTASSDISESLREQILGICRPRPTNNTRRSSGNIKNYTKSSQSQKTLHESSYEIIPSKDSAAYDRKSGGDNTSLSYHTPPPSLEKEESFVVVPRNSEEIPMNDRRYTTITTQTVAIQTTEEGIGAELDCKCCWEGYDCTCQKCECKCRGSNNKKDDYCSCSPEDTSDFSIMENYTESSSQTMDFKRRNPCKCKCNCRPKWNEESSYSDSDDSYTTDFLDLPYQNNEDYFRLLRELEKKLVARNKERVRKTMMEFERRSRQNQNLDKPVCDYSDDNASLLRKLSVKANGNKMKAHGKRHSVCCKCGRNKRVNSDVDSDILQNEKKWDQMNYIGSVVEDNGDARRPPVPNRIERSLHKSHWQLDPRSGEWVKLSCMQQTDFSSLPPYGDYLKEDYKKMPNSGAVHKKDCGCRHRKRHL